MAEETDEKTLDPTPRRRQQARESGQVARSQDLGSAVLLLGGLGLLIFAGGALLQSLAGLFKAYLSGSAWMSELATPNGALAANHWNSIVSTVGRVLLPLLGGATLLAIAGNVMQTGPMFHPERLLPDFSRLNPLTGIGRIFSGGNASRLAFGIFKLGIVAGVAFFSLKNRTDELMALAGLGLPDLARATWELCWGMCLQIGVALLALAAVDFGYQRWQRERDLKMTPQELREEMRTMQGDPQVAARRRGLARQMNANRPAAGGKIDVIVALGDKLAVALRFDAAQMSAPVVAFKAAGATAARLLETSRAQKVPIVEQPALARALYADAELKQAIPGELFATTAEVLAAVYQARDRQPA